MDLPGTVHRQSGRCCLAGHSFAQSENVSPEVIQAVIQCRGLSQIECAHIEFVEPADDCVDLGPSTTTKLTFELFELPIYRIEAAVHVPAVQAWSK